MPLPEVSTLQNSDVVQQQQNPAFMQDPITTPAAPQSAPIPIPGTAQIEQPTPPTVPQKASSGSKFSDPILDSFSKGPRPISTFNAGKLPSYSLADVTQPRYPQYMPGGDNEEVYALNQGTWSKLGHDLVKTGALALGTFAEGMMTIPNTIRAIQSGKYSDLYDNPLTKTTSTWVENMENYLPNYVTHEEQNMNPFLKAIPGFGGAANFWFDGVLKNVGFMAGAIGSAVVQDLAVGALTEGIGDAVLLPTQFGKAALWLNKVFSTTAKTDREILLAGKAATTLGADALNLTNQELTTLRGMQTVAGIRKYASSAEYTMNLYSSGRTMSAQGARDMNSQVVDELTNQFREEHGYEPMGDELQKIQDTGVAAANAKFTIDTGLMMVGESIGFDNLLRPFGTARGEYMSTLQKRYALNLDNVKPIKGGLGKVEYVAPKGIPRKIASGIKPLIPHALAAGPILGGGMFASNVGVKSFYEDRYNEKIQGTLSDAIDALGKGLQGEFMSKEGLESVLIGTAMGFVLGPSQKFIENKVKGTSTKAQRDAIISEINAQTASGFMNVNYDSAAKTLGNAERMKAATESGDIFSYKNFQHEEFVNYVITHMKNKMYDVGIEKLKLMKDIPEDQFKKMWGLDPTGENQRTASQYVDEMINKAKEIKKSRDLIDNIFENPYQVSDKIRTPEADLTRSKKEAFERAKDTLTWFASVHRDTGVRLGDISRDIPRVSGHLLSAETLGNLTSPSGLREYHQQVKEDIRITNDLLKSDISIERPYDKRKLKELEDLSATLDRVLSGTTSADQFNAFKTASDLKAQEKIINSYINSRDPNGKEAIAPESVMQLNTFGQDANRLNNRAVRARAAYDRLSSEEGMSRFMKSEEVKTEKAETAPKTAEQKAEAAEKVNQVKLIDNKTKKEKTFNVGDKFYMSEKDGEPKTEFEIIAKDEDGNLSVAKAGLADEEGHPLDETTYTTDELANKVFQNTQAENEADKVAKDNPPPPGPPPTNLAEGTESGDSIPDLQYGPNSTSDPRYSNNDVNELRDKEGKLTHQRHQTFLFDLSSNDPKIFSQTVKPKLRIMPVHEGNEAALGFPEGWIKSEGGDAETIRAVYVRKEAGESYYVDKKGTTLGKVGDKVDPTKAIYTNFRTAELINSEGQNRYTNKLKLKEEDVKAAWDQQRKAILAKEIPDVYEFTVSRGIGEKTKGSRNSILEVGLVRDADLTRPIIDISTGTEITPSAILNDKGEGLSPHKSALNMGKSGLVVLNHNGILVHLDNRPFNPAEAENLFQLIKKYAAPGSNYNERNLAWSAIKNEIYTLTESSKKNPIKASISIKDRELFLGQKREGIPLNEAALEANKTEITNFFQETFHNILQPELTKIKNKPKDNLTYRSYTVEEGKLVPHEFPNYNHYLLLGAEPILTTSIRVPLEGEPPITQKYSTLKNLDFRSPSNDAIVEKAAPAPKAETSDAVVHEIAAEGKPSLFVKYTQEQVKDGTIVIKEVLGTSPTQEGPFTPSKNQESARKAMQEMADQGLLTKDDSTSGDNSEGLGDPDITFGDDAQTRYTEILPNNYVKADLNVEEAEFHKMLGETFDVVRTADILKNTSGGFAWGAFKDATVFIYQNAEVGTLYHEAFEAVWNSFLKGKEQFDIYKEFADREGSFKTFKGEFKTYEAATFKEAKEQLAEEFRDFKMNGTLPPSPKAKGFFAKLIDFIKKIIFGDTSKVNKLFEAINKGDYRDMSVDTRNFLKEPQYRDIDASEAFIQDTLQGMTSELFSEVFDRNSDILDELAGNSQKLSRDVYSKLHERLRHFYEDKDNGTAYALFNDKYKAAASKPEKDAINAQLRSIRKGWEESINTQWPKFVEAHKEFLSSYAVKFEIDEDGNIRYNEDHQADEDNRSGTEYDRDIFSIDYKNNASARVKISFLLADSQFIDGATSQAYDSLSKSQIKSKRDNSMVGLPKLASYSKVFNYTLHSAANTNNLHNIYNKLAGIAGDVKKGINANLQKWLNRVNLQEGFKNKSLQDSTFAISVGQVLSKMKPVFFRQYVENGKTFFMHTAINNKSREIKTNWIANMQQSDMVNAGEKAFKFKTGIDTKLNNISFLNKLGIDITKEQYESLPAGVQTQFNTATQKIKDTIKDFAKTGSEVSKVTGKTVDFDSRLNALAEIYTTHISGEDTQSQHLNLDNESTSNFAINNAISTILNDHQNSDTLQEFINKQPWMQDIYHADSVIVRGKMYDPETGDLKNIIQIGVAEGRQSLAGDNVGTSKLPQAQRSLAEINNNLNGVFYTLVGADAKTEWVVNPGLFVDDVNYFSDNVDVRRGEFTKWSNQMHRYLQNEVDLARDFKDNKARQNIKELNAKFGDRVKGNSLRFFSDLLPESVVKRIHEEVIDEGKDLSEVISAGDLRPILADLVNKKALVDIKTMTDGGLFEATTRTRNKETVIDAYKLHGIDEKFLTKSLGKKQKYAEEDVRRLMAFREMNYMQGNIEMHKLFAGDPAQYKDELKRIKSLVGGTEATYVDIMGDERGFNKGVGEPILNLAHGKVGLDPKDPGYTVWKNHANTITVRDITVQSAQYEQYKAILGEDGAKAYLAINEADAQVWHFPTGYREILYKSARFSPRQEAAFQWHMAYERSQEAKADQYEYVDSALKAADDKLLAEQPFPDNGVVFPILKLKGSGMQFVDDVAVQSIDKASWAPMFYHWIENQPNKLAAYRVMRNHGIDYMRVESAHKVGIQNNALTDLYNETGHTNIEGLRNLVPEQIPYSSLGVQVETGGTKEANTEGSQLRKIATNNLYVNKIPVDYKGGRANWDALSETQKRKESPIHALVEKHNEILREMSNKRYNEALQRLDVRENEDGTYTFNDLEKVSKFLLSEIARRELPDNIRTGLKVVDGKFTIPLESNVRYPEIKRLLYSMIDKNILRAKVNGGPKTQLSNTMFEGADRIIAREVNGKPVFVSNDLKSYTVGEDGKTLASEVYLPYWFGQKVRETLQKKYNFKTDRAFKDHLLNYLNKTEEGRNLLSGIGFRIPTQTENSIDHFIVKDFLPEQMGDTIVLPSEITAKAGSDFDIDKLNTYLRNFYVDKDGYPKKIKFERIDTNNEAELTDYYNKYVLDDYHAYQVAQKEYESKRTSSDFMDAIFGSEASDIQPTEPEYVPSREEFLIQKKGANHYELNSRKAIENEYFDVLQDIMSLPEKYKSLISPNDASLLKGISKKIVRMADPELSKKTASYGNILDSQYMATQRGLFMSSKGLIGISAVSQTGHSVFQLAGVTATDNFHLRLPHNVDNNQVSFAGVYSKGTEMPISGVISQVTDGGVDAAKDTFLADMGCNKSTANKWLMLLRAGVPAYDTALFMNQPIIKEWERSNEINNTAPAVTGKSKDPQYTITGNVASKFGGDLKLASKDIPNMFSQKDMENAIEKYGKGNKLTDQENVLQRAMLAHYLTLRQKANQLFDYTQGYNWDTERLGDPAAVLRKKLQLEKAQGLPFTPIADTLATSFIGAYMDNVVKMDNMIRTLLPVWQGFSEVALNLTAKSFFNSFTYGKADIYQRYMAKAELGILDYATQTEGMIKGNSISSYTKALMTGENSTANYIKAIQESEIQRLTNNPIIANLRPIPDGRPGYPHTIELKAKDFDTYTSNIWTDAFKALRDDATVIKGKTVSQIYDNLVVTAALQSGVGRTPNSFLHLIPNEDYVRVLGEGASKVNDKGEDFYYLGALYRNNWADDTLVPPVGKKFDDAEREISPFLGNKKLMSDIDPSGKPQIIRLRAFEYGDKRMVKLVDYKRNAEDRVTDKIIRIFQRVDVAENEPLINNVPNGYGKTTKHVIFAEVNKWGDRFIKEYPDGLESSYKSNPPVKEYADEQIIEALYKNNYSLENIDPSQYDRERETPDPEDSQAASGSGPSSEIDKKIDDLDITKDC